MQKRFIVYPFTENTRPMVIHLHIALLLLLTAGGFCFAWLFGTKSSKKLLKRSIELQAELETCRQEISSMKQVIASAGYHSPEAGKLTAGHLRRPGKTA